MIVTLDLDLGQLVELGDFLLSVEYQIFEGDDGYEVLEPLFTQVVGRGPAPEIMCP
jgi:hypothetical protein|tara:strand:- start:552 stop:719 length:168 start_codon:yes stop_codon:yes gene_type:complete